MSKGDDSIRLRHMLDYTREAIALVHGKTRLDLNQDRLLQLGLTRLIEVVGEAAARMSADVQAQYPQIPWPQIVSTMNRLIHGYDFVDLEILWQTVTEDLPMLAAGLEWAVSSQDTSGDGGP